MITLACTNTTELHTHVRPMQTADLDQVLAIEQSSFSTPWPISAYRYELNENKHSTLWVAEVESMSGKNQVVGMTVLWLILDEAHIATLAVHSDYRRLGIARCLLITALKEAIHKGASEATLEVRAGNHAAQELYRSLHFQVVGHRHRYYHDTKEDGIIMTVKFQGNEHFSRLDIDQPITVEQ